jgi:hypothetical protein
MNMKITLFWDVILRSSFTLVVKSKGAWEAYVTVPQNTVPEDSDVVYVCQWYSQALKFWNISWITCGPG